MPSLDPKLLRWSAYLSFLLLILTTLSAVFAFNASRLGLNYLDFRTAHIVFAVLLVISLLIHSVVGMKRILRGWLYTAFVAFSVIYALFLLYFIFFFPSS